MFGTIQMGEMKIYVSEAAIPQIVAIRYCTQKKEKESVSHLSVSRLRAAVCRFPAHTPVHHTLRSLWLFFIFS